MLLFKKKSKKQTCPAPLLSELRVLTVELIASANRAEAEVAPTQGVEVTSAGEVRTARALIASQNELLRAISAAGTRGVSVAVIRAEVIEPTIEKSVVGDMAWVMLSTVLASAENGVRTPLTPPGLRPAANQ